MNRIILLVSLSPFLASCAALSSVPEPIDNGVPYYLPRTLVSLTIDEPSGTITAQPSTSANPDRRYYLSLNENASSDDRLCIVRSEGGLLQKVYFSADDRTDDILVNIVQLAGEFGADPADVTSSPAIDPYNEIEVAAFNARIAPLAVKFPTVPRGGLAAFACPENSVCFGTKTDLPVELYRDGQLLARSTVSVVDQASPGAIVVKRGFMSVRVTKLDFADGVLTQFRVRKDSEAAAAALLPLRALERLLSVPGNAVAAAFGTYEERKAELAHRKEFATPAASEASPGDYLDIDKCGEK